jgi:hypothetical protein
VEVLISAGLTGFILTGVLSTFLFLGRSSANIVNYSDMETEARKGLESFAVDTREASDLYWIDANTIRLSIGTGFVNYGYDTTTKSFYRVAITRSGSSGSYTYTESGPRRALINRVEDFSFRGYQINATAPIDISDLSTVSKQSAASNVTKQIQISMRAIRKDVTVVGVTNSVFSARYILRNKKVTV